MSEHEDYPPCPKCGSIRVTAVRAPHLIAADDGAAGLQTHDEAFQCVCGAVFTVPNLPAAEQTEFLPSVTYSQQLRKKNPR